MASILMIERENLPPVFITGTMKRPEIPDGYGVFEYSESKGRILKDETADEVARILNGMFFEEFGGMPIKVIRLSGMARDKEI